MLISNHISLGGNQKIRGRSVENRWISCKGEDLDRWNSHVDTEENVQEETDLNHQIWCVDQQSLHPKGHMSEIDIFWRIENLEIRGEDKRKFGKGEFVK